MSPSAFPPVQRCCGAAPSTGPGLQPVPNTSSFSAGNFCALRSFFGIQLSPGPAGSAGRVSAGAAAVRSVVVRSGAGRRGSLGEESGLGSAAGRAGTRSAESGPHRGARRGSPAARGRRRPRGARQPRPRRAAPAITWVNMPVF